LRNPKVSDDALRWVIQANIVDFKGYISVATKIHKFAENFKLARIIYISPYGNDFKNFLISIKRAVIGVEFGPLTHNCTHMTQYVLGTLADDNPEYHQAKKEAEQAFKQKRRFTIIIANDGTDFCATLEQDKERCLVM
jgi:hypothetical protein